MKILKTYSNKLRYLNYSERTISIYVCYFQKFLEEENIKDPYQVTTKQVVQFLENKEYSSSSVQNQYIGALKFFLENILKRKSHNISSIKRPKKQRKIPRIIDAESLVRKIKSVENLKHRSILTLGLSCGLRVGEVINLKWEHLNRDRNLLYVINGKGKKDRAAPLNDSTIKLLEDYWIEYRSKDYVLNGQKRSRYSQSSIQNIIKKYIHPKASFHLLRHAFATYAIDNGTELKPLSVSMGHNSTKTVERFYFHQSDRTLKTIKQAI